MCKGSSVYILFIPSNAMSRSTRSRSSKAAGPSEEDLDRLTAVKTSVAEASKSLGENKPTKGNLTTVLNKVVTNGTFIGSETQAESIRTGIVVFLSNPKVDVTLSEAGRNLLDVMFPGLNLETLNTAEIRKQVLRWRQTHSKSTAEVEPIGLPIVALIDTLKQAETDGIPPEQVKIEIDAFLDAAPEAAGSRVPVGILPLISRIFRIALNSDIQWGDLASKLYVWQSAKEKASPRVTHSPRSGRSTNTNDFGEDETEDNDAPRTEVDLAHVAKEMGKGLFNVAAWGTKKTIDTTSFLAKSGIDIGKSAMSKRRAQRSSTPPPVSRALAQQYLAPELTEDKPLVKQFEEQMQAIRSSAPNRYKDVYAALKHYVEGHQASVKLVKQVPYSAALSQAVTHVSTDLLTQFFDRMLAPSQPGMVTLIVLACM